MKTDIWMPIYLGDYMKDTHRLSTEEHGAYLLLLMELWISNGILKKNPLVLSRLVRTDIRNFESVIWPALEDYFVIEGNPEVGHFISHNRLNEELFKSRERRIKASENGKRGGRPRNKPRGLPDGLPEHNPMGNPQKSSSPSQYTNNKNFLKDEKIKEPWE